MKSSDRTILIVIPLLAAVIGLWVLVISPKRSEAGDLQDKVTSLQASLTTSDQEATTAEAARRDFSENYSALIDLGAAAPADNDQATLVYDLATIASGSSIRFTGFQLADTASTSAPPAAAPAATDTSASTESTTSTPPEATSSDANGSTPAATTTSTTTTATTSAAPATEATAATLPLGAAVGPAGLPVSKYTFNLGGTYFNALDFIAGVDETVEPSETRPPRVHGRLLTIDGFSFSLEQLDDFPMMTANFAVTAYAVPADQGLDAGATPAGPAPVGTTPDSTTTTTAAPTATVTP